MRFICRVCPPLEATSNGLFLGPFITTRLATFHRHLAVQHGKLKGWEAAEWSRKVLQDHVVKRRKYREVQR